MVSKTKGISTAWHAPNPSLTCGSGQSKRYIQVLAQAEAARASATRMAGTRKNQSLMTAARVSPGVRPGRLAR